MQFAARSEKMDPVQHASFDAAMAEDIAAVEAELKALQSGIPATEARSHRPVYEPFVDHDLFDFLTTLSSSMLIDHHFHDDTIARAYPQFAHAPYSHDATSGSDSRATRTRFATDMARAFVMAKPSRLTKNVTPRAKFLATVMSGSRLVP